MNNLLSSLTTHQLRQAADLKEKIEALTKELALLLGAPATAAATAPKKGKMSASGRAKIAAAQKARWAKVKAANPFLKLCDRLLDFVVKCFYIGHAESVRKNHLA